MHHNCCSLSSLNYVLLAQEQVNNTSSVYCSDQPCYLNRWLTKERGNPQFADSASQELANSNYISKKGSQANFAWCSVRLIKKRGRGGLPSQPDLKLSLLGRVFVCVCVWGRVLSALTMSEVSFPGGTFLPAALECGEEQSASEELQVHAAFGTPTRRRGASLGTRGSSPRRVIPSLSPSQGLPRWSMRHEVLPRIGRRSILFCFKFCSLSNVDPQFYMYKTINLYRRPSSFM